MHLFATLLRNYFSSCCLSNDCIQASSSFTSAVSPWEKSRIGRMSASSVLSHFRAVPSFKSWSFRLLLLLLAVFLPLPLCIQVFDWSNWVSFQLSWPVRFFWQSCRFVNSQGLLMCVFPGHVRLFVHLEEPAHCQWMSCTDIHRMTDSSNPLLPMKHTWKLLW